MPKVLIADDESHVTYILSRKIANAGFDVLTASDGQQALGLIQQNLPDLVVTDYQMPVLTGYDMCVRLKQDSRTRDIPVIMLTARGHHLSEEHLARTNIRILLSKPFSARDLLEHINKIVAAAHRAPIAEAS